MDTFVNAMGQRVYKSGTVSEYFVYDNAGRLIGEYHNDGRVIQEYVYIAGRLAAVLRNAGIYYVHSDQLGAPRLITDAMGNAVWRWDPEPFGTTAPNEDPRNTGTAFTFNLRFPGQYYDKEVGLSYNHFRYYDPQIGRYVESDPIGLRGGINTYTYVGGNPVSYADPLGLWGGGITFSVSTINPFTSGGGGTYGFNLEYTSSGGWGLYSLGTPNDVPSQGFIPGFSLTVNGATGTGDWSGPFDSTNGSYGLGTGGFFQSSPSPDPNPGYFGWEGGLSFGPPGMGSTTTNYTPIWLQNPPQAASGSQCY